MQNEMIIYSIQTYNDLSDALSESVVNDPNAYATLDKAFSRIQLFGSAEQVDLGMKYLQEIADKKGRERTNIIPMVVSLRDQLRRELGLPPILTTVKHLHYHPKQVYKQDSTQKQSVGDQVE